MKANNSFYAQLVYQEPDASDPAFVKELRMGDLHGFVDAPRW
jgi:hypothetical protein